MADAEEEADTPGAAGQPAAVELVMKSSLEDVRRSLTLEDVQWRSSVGDSLLCYAARRPEEVGDAGKVCRHLVEALGLPVGEVSKWNQNPLFYAARGGIPEAIAYLLGARADPHLRDVNEQTPLFYAASCSSHPGSLHGIRLLLERRVEAKQKDRNGQTPLFYAAKEGRADACDLLIGAR